LTANATANCPFSTVMALSRIECGDGALPRYGPKARRHIKTEPRAEEIRCKGHFYSRPAMRVFTGCFHFAQ